MEPNRDEVGVRLDDSLQERVGAYAGREGLTVGETDRAGRTPRALVAMAARHSSRNSSFRPAVR